MMRGIHQQQFKRVSGMTILEIMMTVTILGFIAAMTFGFFTESIKATFTSEQKNLINRDIRRLTAELSEAAREANFVTLYNSFKEEDRDDVADRLLAGNSGDFLVFGFQGEPDLSTSINAPQPIMRLIGYYRAPEDPDDPTSLGPVRFFDTDEDFSFNDDGDPLNAPFNPLDPPSLEGLLADLYPESGWNSNDMVVEMSEGLADNQLFYNFGKSTIMVNGKIIHGVEAKRVTDTYNFTIATRR